MVTKSKLLTLVSSLVFGLSGCAGYRAPVKVDGRPRICFFDQGKTIGFNAGVSAGGVDVGVKATHTRTSQSITLGYDFFSQALVLSTGSVGVSASSSKLGLSVGGIYLAPIQQQVGTTLLSAGSGGVKFISPYALPFFLFGKRSELFGIIESLGTGQTPQKVYDFSKNVLLGDLLPYYPLREVYYTTKRVLGLGTSVSGENLEEILSEISSSRSNSERLSLLESNVQKYPKLSGLFKLMYDSQLLKESFLVFNRDIKDLGKNTLQRVQDNMLSSQQDLEGMVSEGVSSKNYWSYLGALVHISNLAATTFSIQADKGPCFVNMDGPYLFLADDSSTDAIFENFVKIAEHYSHSGFATVQNQTLSHLTEAMQHLDASDYFKFKESFESFYYSYRYGLELQQNFSPDNLRRLSDYLLSRGRTKLSRQISSIPSRTKNNLDLTLAAEYLHGIYDLIKKSNYPARDVCSLDRFEGSYLDLPAVTVTFQELSKTVSSLSLDNPRKLFYDTLFKHYQQLLSQHVQKYSSEVNFYWDFSVKSYVRASSAFWDLVSDLNEEHHLGYSSSDLAKLKTSVSPISPVQTTRFYHQFRRRFNPQLDSDARSQLNNLFSVMRTHSQYLSTVSSLEFKPTPRVRCEYPQL